MKTQTDQEQVEQFIASCSLQFINLMHSQLLEEPYKVRELFSDSCLLHDMREKVCTVDGEEEQISIYIKLREKPSVGFSTLGLFYFQPGLAPLLGVIKSLEWLDFSEKLLVLRISSRDEGGGGVSLR